MKKDNKMRLDYNTENAMTDFLQFVDCEECAYYKYCKEFSDDHNADLCDAMSILIARH